jgi:pantetheine-phosphate adenylyltransferase
LRIALYPGSFDPVTNGHVNLIERGLEVFDRLVVAVATNVNKTPLFTVDDRMAMIREVIHDNERVDVDSFSGLLVDYAAKRKASVILRGLRAISDFEFEFQMTHMNRRLKPDIEIVFMMTDEEFFFVSSQLVREVASFGGNVSGLVPTHVERMLAKRFAS